MSQAVRNFFDANSRYGSLANPKGYQYRPGQFAQTPVGKTYANDQSNFGAVYDRALAGNNVNPLGDQGKYLSSLAPRLQTGYKSALLTNPMLNQQDYIAQSIPGLMNEWLGLGAQGQGRNQGLYAPVARTQARGF